MNEALVIKALELANAKMRENFLVDGHPYVERTGLSKHTIATLRRNWNPVVASQSSIRLSPQGTARMTPEEVREARQICKQSMIQALKEETSWIEDALNRLLT